MNNIQLVEICIAGLNYGAGYATVCQMCSISFAFAKLKHVTGEL